MAIFTAAEIHRRWTEVRRHLGEAECLVATSFHGSYYLSGLPVARWGRSSVTILFGEDEPVLVTPDFEASAAAQNAPIADVRLYRDEDGPTLPVVAARVAEVLRERGVRVVGIEAQETPVALQDLIAQQLPEATFVDRTDALTEARLISSPEELAYLREAARLVDVGMARALELLVPGRTEREIAHGGQRAMEDAAALDVALNVSCYMQQGARSAECHGVTSLAPITEGQIVEILCEAEVAHYQSAVERCVLIGDVTPDVERAVETSLRAFDAARDALRIGQPLGAADVAARAVLHEAGYEHITTGSGLVRGILHHTGGRMEAGELRAHNPRPLAPGMVLTIEPWAIVDGVGGPRRCDMVHATADGLEALTQSPAGWLRAGETAPAASAA